MPHAIRNLAAASALTLLMAAPAFAADISKAPPPAPYQKVSELFNLLDFIPGRGTVYVDPKTLPDGPWLAYDQQGKLVSTTYMIPLNDINEHKNIVDLAAPGGNVDHISVEFSLGHPGVPEPHYHIVLWHVPKAEQQLISK